MLFGGAGQIEAAPGEKPGNEQEDETEAAVEWETDADRGEGDCRRRESEPARKEQEAGGENADCGKDAEDGPRKERVNGRTGHQRRKAEEPDIETAYRTSGQRQQPEQPHPQPDGPSIPHAPTIPCPDTFRGQPLRIKKHFLILKG